VRDPIYGTGVETGLVIAIPLGLHLLDAAVGAPPSNPPKEPAALSVALPPAFSGLIIASRFQVYAQTGTSSLAVSVIGFVVAALAWISRPARRGKGDGRQLDGPAAAARGHARRHSESKHVRSLFP
jgi:hypothetical protein